MENFQILAKETANSKILKFESNKLLVEGDSYEFSNIDEAKDSPIAQQLFYLPFVKKVYISANFISIERFDIVEWDEVKNEVAIQIQNYLNGGGLVVTNTNQEKIAVTIYSESTPNPAVLKFVSNKILVPSIFEFNSIEEAKKSPFATALFQFPFVKSVFLDKNYVSITKFDVVEWNEITNELRTFIKQYIEEKKSIIDSSTNKAQQQASVEFEKQKESLDDTSKEIINILDEYVRPAVASDGGNILFESYNPTTKIVKVILQGACSGCPSSTFTLKNGIENMLKEMMGEKIGGVEAVNS